jgi:hypothetical protein
VPTDLSQVQAAAVEHAVKGSFLAGYRLVMVIGAIMAIASALVAWRLIPARSRALVRPGGDGATSRE